jgi:hypothetical protein
VPKTSLVQTFREVAGPSPARGAYYYEEFCGNLTSSESSCVDVSARQRLVPSLGAARENPDTTSGDEIGYVDDTPVNG